METEWVYVLSIIYPKRSDPRFEVINVNKSKSRAKEQAQAHLDVYSEWNGERLTWVFIPDIFGYMAKSKLGTYRIQKKAVL